MKRFLTLLLFLPATLCSLRAQQGIGFNADGNGFIEPHPAAVIEIQSSDKGVLTPRLTYEQRLKMQVDSTLDGLLVFQTNRNLGYYLVQDGQWLFLNPILIPDAGSTDEPLSFAKVAYTGDYYDLKNRPELPTGGDEDTATFARVATTGDYNDLLNRPVIISDLGDIAPVAYTGNYNDLTEKPFLPTKLRELTQDSAHRTVTSDEIEYWNGGAARKVPTALSDYETDEFRQTVTYVQRFGYDEAAGRTIPTATAELAYDEFAQLVSDADIARWEAAAKRTIPTMLRELEEDSAHRTINETQYNRWTTHAAAMAFDGNYADLSDLPDIPRHLSQFTTDELHQIISYKERDDWDSAYRRTVPTKLSELKDDNMNYRLVSKEEIARWDSMTARPIPTYEDNDDNAFILYGNPAYMDNYRPISAFGRQGTWSSLVNRPTFSPNTAPVTGNYADLDEATIPKLQAVTSGFLSSLSYNDLLYDKPTLSRFVTSGKAEDMSDVPEYLSDFREDASETSVYVSNTDRRNFRTAKQILLTDGLYPPNPDYSSHNVQGTFETLKLMDNIALEGVPTIKNTQTAATYFNSTAYDAHVPTVQVTRELDALAVQQAKSKMETIPEGAVMMWGSSNPPSGTDVHGGCWKKFDALAGRFPVGAQMSSNTFGGYTYGAEGGAETVTLTIDQMPKHRHRVYLGVKETSKNDHDLLSPFGQDDFDVNRTFSNYTNDESISYNSIGESDGNSTYYGDAPFNTGYTTQPHNNLPPYYVINFIYYTKQGCPNN
ncbi:MAG: hypothetical protein NC048_02705 [Bacteroides sp.]|nr:hypothetical protein [Bacteroides sp.]MCM1531450.1 hypothetical protein [Ruminococcus flavefaciens]MCM1554388.1 hypothetical protein [Bacteroides sp.]